ncbi:MAG: ABC transporter ATP-binding protein [Tissierellales bacterium]|nr:ABC transporter ATP-binding protein [Tissierellales bacterium]
MNYPLLRIEHLDTGYGQYQVLFDLSLNVNDGEIVSLIGPNGSGKSTILKSICGLLRPWKGSIMFQGRSLTDSSVAQHIKSGLTFSPQGNRVFDELTVMENLEIAGFGFQKEKLKNRIDMIIDLFPDLKNRMKEHAGNLSGGEQQMLALARALVPEPKLLLLDEPSLGLAPNLVKDTFEKLFEINKSKKITMLVVEQKVNEVLNISDRVYSVKLGRVLFEDASDKLKGNKKKLKELFL